MNEVYYLNINAVAYYRPTYQLIDFKQANNYENKAREVK